MTDAVYTLEQVATLINSVAAGIRRGDEDTVYSVDEVHDRTGFAKRPLWDDIRNNRIAYTRRGNTIGLTPGQLADLIRSHAAGKGATTPALDALAQARQASAKAAARSGTRRSKAAA